MDQETTGTTGTTTVTAALQDKVGLFGPLGFLDVLAMGASVADALRFREAAHGQVRPAAIVDDPPTGDDAWSLLEPDATPATGLEVARAPELAPGEASPAGDVYALGAVLIYALTGNPFEPTITSGEPAGEDTAVDTPDDPTPADDRTLPEVMAAFLATLRSTLASAAGDRPTASELATALRSLRIEADQAMEGVAVGPSAAGDTLTQVVMIAADGTLLNAQGEVIGTTRRDAKPAGRQWLPLAIAALALVVAVGAVVVFATRPEQIAFAPTTTVATTTTLPITTTTAAPETVPPSTLPAGLIAVSIDTSKSVSCRNCAIPLFSLPTKPASTTGQFPDKTQLWAKCFANGDRTDDSGFGSNQWLYIQGPGAIQGWISTVWVGRQTYGLPGCPPSITPAPTTTAAPTTVPTTAVPTTVPTTPPPTVTTIAPTTTKLTPTTPSTPVSPTP